jgi:hypothetical protein
MEPFHFSQETYQFKKSRRDLAAGGKPHIPGKPKKRTVHARIEGKYYLCDVISVSLAERTITVNVLASGEEHPIYPSYTLPWSQVRRLELEEVVEDVRLRQELVNRSRYAGNA